MKKILFWLLTSLQALLFAGIFILDDLSHHHMTMYRTILLNNRTWKAELPIDAILVITAVFLAVMGSASVIVMMIWALRRERIRFWLYFNTLLLAAVSGGSAIFIRTSSTDSYPVFYYAVMALIAITVFQLVKTTILSNPET